MSEEEIIEKYHHFKIKTADGIELDLIETKYYKELLDLYKQEKEKNKELEEKLKISVAMLTKGTYPEENEGDNNFDKKIIAVDKIKEKIEDYEKMVEGTFKDNTWNGQNRRDNCCEIIKVLENLLEEK